MKNIAVFYGGKSVEHDISIITALQAMNGIAKSLNVIPIYITPKGKMLTAKNLTDGNVYLNFEKNVNSPREVVLFSGSGEIGIIKNNKIKEKIKIDCALLCNHGHGGEDGSLQGCLELAEIPYTSSDVPSSALCMDKVLTKIMLEKNFIASPKYVYIGKCEYMANKDKIVDEIQKIIKFPCIVKPARLGSSVGISICENAQTIASALENAFAFDNKIIVEKFVENAREFCCAVVKNSDIVITSKVTEVKKGKIYTFEEKYLSQQDNKKSEISKDLEKRIKSLAIKAYNALLCSGVVRVDFLYDEKTDKLYVNELNSIPGSLSFNMFDTSFSDLINILLAEGIKRKEEQNKTIYTFNSEAIERYISMTANIKSK